VTSTDASSRARARMYRRRRVTVFGGGGVILVALVYLAMTLFAPVPAASAVLAKSVSLTQTAGAPVFPGYGASAIGAVGWDGTLGTGGSSAPQPMASITKIVTALVVLEKKPLTGSEQGPTLTLSALDVSYVQRYKSQLGKVIPMIAGQRFSEREMLEVALIESANNYATSLAVWAFGSEQAYVTAAKAWTAAHGLTGTNIDDTCGMSDKSASTATDLVKLGEMALQNPVIAEIVNTKKMTIDGLGEIDNTNKLLGKAGIDGIKTGTLYTYGSNLLFSSDWRIGGRTVTLVGAVLGGADGKSVNADVRTLVSSTKKGFHAVTLAEKGASFASWSTSWGQKANAVATEAKTVVVWGDTPITAAVVTDKVGVAALGTRVGSVTYTIGSGTKVTVPLGLSKAIADPGPWWRLTNPGGFGG
jgi:serine-type D-Ala-D-Ala carboxypeptidase (penicillin-binding protein 5/6)